MKKKKKKTIKYQNSRLPCSNTNYPPCLPIFIAQIGIQFDPGPTDWAIQHFPEPMIHTFHMEYVITSWKLSARFILPEAIQTNCTILGQMGGRGGVAETGKAVHRIRGGIRRRRFSGCSWRMAISTTASAAEGGGGEEKVDEDDGGESEEEEKEGEYEGHDDAFEENEKEPPRSRDRILLGRSLRRRI